MPHRSGTGDCLSEMSDRVDASGLKVLVDYLGQLTKQVVLIAVLIIDIIVFALGLFVDIPIPHWVYWVVFAVSLFWASFRVYAEQERIRATGQKRYKSEIDALRTELQEIRAQAPKLELYFQTQEGPVDQLPLTIPLYPQPPDIESQIGKARSDLAYKPPKVSLPELGAFLFSHPTAEQLKEYNDEVEHYVEELRTHLERKDLYDVLMCRIHAIRIAVHNTGQCPAHDVSMFMSFPDSLRLASEEDLPSEPEAPCKPRLRKGIFDIVGGLSSVPHLPAMGDFGSHVGVLPTKPEVSGPDITEERSTQVRYWIGMLMHNIPEENLEPFFVIVPEERVNRVFDVPYEIHASEVPDPAEGALVLDLRYESGASDG